MVKNIRPWALERVWSSLQGVLHSRLLHDFPYPPLLFLMQSRLKQYHWGPLQHLWSLRDNFSWPGQTLESFNTSYMCMSARLTCSGRKPIFYFFLLGKCACLWHLCPLTQLHTLTKKSFLFSSHLSCFLKKVLESLSPQSCGLCRPPLLSVF